MKIIQLSKAETLCINMYDQVFREQYDSNSECIDWILSHSYSYIALGDNGEIYVIQGDYLSKNWYAIRFSLKSSAAAGKNIYKALINVEPANTRSSIYAKRKDLISALESGDINWSPYQRALPEDSTLELTGGDSDMLVNIDIRPSKATLNTRIVERSRPASRPGLKRVAIAFLLSLLGIFLPGVSLVAVPLFLSGSEVLLKQAVPAGQTAQTSLRSSILLSLGMVSGAIGIFLPVFSFISLVLIGQSYTFRWPHVYTSAKS